MRFVDLFAGLGGFHYALRSLGHECVFASELDDELRDLYQKNFPKSAEVVYGDICAHKDDVPAHEILCAGFPCQPFSKSGRQHGILDTRGTLFHEIIRILERRRPSFVILENVGNFERHDQGATWRTVRESLIKLGYNVRGTEHVRSGGHGLISPHHFGHPHTRERFFAVGSLQPLPQDPFPRPHANVPTTLTSIVQSKAELSSEDLRETALTERQTDCIDLWNWFLSLIPEEFPLPSFPIWGDEIDAAYPYDPLTPYSTPLSQLRLCMNGKGSLDSASREELLRSLPSYAREEKDSFPNWKIRFIRDNREFFASVRKYLPKRWISDLKSFPPSLRKLEWNSQGEVRDLWKHVLQFRPSGLRVKRYTTVPALVAMTTTQIPILGPKGRFITRTEGLRLQGFPDRHLLPKSRASAFAALGNAVHVDVVKRIAKQLLIRDPAVFVLSRQIPPLDA